VGLEDPAAVDQFLCFLHLARANQFGSWRRCTVFTDKALAADFIWARWILVQENLEPVRMTCLHGFRWKRPPRAATEPPATATGFGGAGLTTSARAIPEPDAL